MSIEHVEVLVEEPSAEAVLRLLLPRVLGAVSFEIRPHQCKDELLQRLPERLRGYRAWLPPNWRILVIVDRDDEDCTGLKQRMEAIARDAGLTTRSTAGGRDPFTVVNRLAIEELEAWYFGDWEAVRTAYPRVPATVPAKARYRLPDAVAGGTWESFERILRSSGYFTSGLRKIEAARHIGEHMLPERNSSPSFQAVRSALVEMVAL